MQNLFNTLRRIKINAGYWLIQKMQISKRELEPVPTIFTKIGDFLLKPFVNKNLIPQILMGPFSFQIFRVSHDIGLFNYLNLHPGATLNEISKQLNLENYPTKILLLGLTGLKLIKKVGENYYTSAATRIVTQDPTNKFTYFFPKYLAYAHNILLHGIHHLQDAIKENKPVGLHKMFGEQATDYYYELSKDPTTNQLFSQHMSAFSQINAQRLAELALFNQIDTLLDVGGGCGDVAISIARYHPNIKITVYDHPSVAAEAEKNIHAADLSQRINTIGSDVIADNFPNNYQGILFSHFIDIFSPSENIAFFTRAFTALNPQGHLIVYTPVVDDNENGPLVNCLLGIYFLCLANGKGRFYSSAQIVDWMKEVGYKNIKIHRLPSAEAIIVGRKA